MSTKRMRIVIADDHPAISLAVSYELEKLGGIKLIARVKDSTELIEVLDQRECDVLVSDYMMPGGKFGDGIALFTLLRRRYPELRIVVLSMVNNPALSRALLQLGIQCVLSKSDAIEHIGMAVRAANNQEQYFSPSIKDGLVDQMLASSNALTHRETEIVRLFGAGMSVTEIARLWNRSVQTISTQKSSAMKKLGIKRDSDLIKYASNWNVGSGN